MIMTRRHLKKYSGAYTPPLALLHLILCFQIPNLFSHGPEKKVYWLDWLAMQSTGIRM